MDQSTNAVSPFPTINPPAPTTTIVSSSKPSGANKKMIGAIIGIFLLVVGLVSGLFLVSQRQQFQQKAWDCSKYHFVMTKEGQITAVNDSTNAEPLQQADVFINNAKVTTVDVPALNPGQSTVIGQVTVPATGTFNWEVRGLADCSSTGSFTAQETAKCVDIKAYDENWTLLSAAELTTLKAGSVVRFAVTGSTSTGAFSKARFKINGELGAEVTTKRPTSEDFYTEFTVPKGTTTFTIFAELFHSQFNKWF